MNKNNFDGIRICLALIVFFAHVYSLTLLDQFKFLGHFFNSNFAVKGFFCISGYLVTLSYLNSVNVKDYLEKRIRRIYPAYFTSISFCFILGLTISKLSSYEFLTSKESIKYLISNIFLLNFLQPTLPFVFENNTLQAMNGALWTIKVEVMLYFCIPFIIYFYNLIGKKTTTIIIFSCSIVWVYLFTFHFKNINGQEIARQFPGQLSYFILGSFCAANRNYIKLNVWGFLFSIITIYLFNQPIVNLFLHPITYSVIVLFLSTNAYRNVNFGKYGDISYGIYLFHFPIIQLVLHLGLFNLNPWLGLCLSLSLTLALAFLSWHFVEKKLLRRNSHYVISSN